MTSTYALIRATEREWIINDESTPPGDPHRIVGCLTVVDDNECEALWMRDLPLRRWYCSPGDAMEDLLSIERARTPQPA